MIADFLNQLSPLESPEETARRDAVTREIETLANGWLSREDPTAPPAKLLTFGSSILGVVTNESDLDTVLLLPASITRDRFFDSFVELLRQSALPHFAIESLMAIPDAHVPVLKMVVNGLPVDILPCRVPVKNLRTLLDSADSNSVGQLNFDLIAYKDLDHPSLLALNGVRVGRTLVDSIRVGRVIAEDERVDGGEDRLVKFQSCLRLIKLWAQKRGIYSNALGYFGGVTWAILLVKTCLSAVPESPSSLVIDTCTDEMELLRHFFQQCHEYRWGVSNPVSLRPLPAFLSHYLSTISVTSESTGTVSPPTGARESILWDPSQSEADRKSFMPVLTPVAPYMNSTFNTVQSTYRILQDEFRRGAELIAQRDVPTVDTLTKLCQVEIFPTTGALLTLQFSAPQGRLQFVWESLIQSKLRVLVFHLERMPGVICRPFPDAVDLGEESREFRIGLSFVPVNGTLPKIDLNFAVGQFHGAFVNTLDTRPDGPELKESCRLAISLKSRNFSKTKG